MTAPVVPDEIVERYATKTRCTRHDAASKTCAYAHGAPCQCRCDVESAAETLGMVSAAALAVLRKEAVAVPVIATEKQLDEGVAAGRGAPVPLNGPAPGYQQTGAAYDAMLAASPYAQAQETQG